MQISIEHANISDYLDIGYLIKNELGYIKLNPENLKDTLTRMLPDKNYAVFVAKQDGKTVGFMGLCKDLTFQIEGEVVRIIALAVDKSCQRTGIGAQLLGQAEQYAAENNVHYITLTSGLHRAEAHLFYEHNGFEKQGFNFKKNF